MTDGIFTKYKRKYWFTSEKYRMNIEWTYYELNITYISWLLYVSQINSPGDFHVFPSEEIPICDWLQSLGWYDDVMEWNNITLPSPLTPLTVYRLDSIHGLIVFIVFLQLNPVFRNCMILHLYILIYIDVFLLSIFFQVSILRLSFNSNYFFFLFIFSFLYSLLLFFEYVIYC